MTEVARRLLERTPLDATAVHYFGPSRATFRAACRARNPRVRVLEADAPKADVLVLEDLGLLTKRPDLVRRLRAPGTLVAAIPPGSSARIEAGLALVTGAGLHIRQVQPLRTTQGYFDDDAANLNEAAEMRFADPTDDGLVLVARRGASDAAEPPMRVRMVTFAPRLMDIRTRLPAVALRADPDLLVTFEGPLKSFPAAPRDAPKVVVLQRPALTDMDAWRATTRRMIEGGWLVVIEIDDHPSLISRVVGRDASREDWLRLSYAHGVQTSTEELADVFRAHNPEVAVFPNAVFELAPFQRKPPSRVFYGGVTRGAFVADVARALAPACEETPEAEFVVVGDRAFFDALPTGRKTFHDYLPYESYLEAMGSCSISLSPLAAQPLVETKSDAKFLDASARGLLTIASPTVYRRTIKHGLTGLIADELADWPRLLGQALRDPAATERMAKAAWAYVRDHRMFAAQAARRREWYLDLWRRRQALDSALLERMSRPS